MVVVFHIRVEDSEFVANLPAEKKRWTWEQEFEWYRWILETYVYAHRIRRREPPFMKPTLMGESSVIYSGPPQLAQLLLALDPAFSKPPWTGGWGKNTSRASVFIFCSLKKNCVDTTYNFLFMSETKRDTSPQRKAKGDEEYRKANDRNRPAFCVYAVRDGGDGLEEHFVTKAEAKTFLNFWRDHSGLDGGPRYHYGAKDMLWIEKIEVFAKATDTCLQMWH
jgi:hypothetical protein